MWEGSNSQDRVLNVTPKLIKSNEICQREGFIPHPTDKEKYYRCLHLRSGKFLLYEFSCNSGIWDQIKQMCSNPRNVNETNDSKSEEGNTRNICVELQLILKFNNSTNELKHIVLHFL